MVSFFTMNTRRDLSVSDKLKILKIYDLFAKIDRCEVASKLEISQVALSRLLRNRSEIECATIQNESQNRKRIRGDKEDDVENALKQLFF